MKYLKKREDYLVSIQESKRINQIYRKEEKVRLITEEAPFENDIPWGDSLVGRLINSVIRKAKIGGRITRINGCIRRLKDTFDEIILSSVIGDISQEDKRTYAKILAANYFREIQRAVDDYANGEGSLEEIKNLVQAAIDYLENDENAKDMPNKREIVLQLNEFLDFLEGLVDEGESQGEGEGQEEGEEEGQGEGQGEGENKEEGEGGGKGEGKEGDKDNKNKNDALQQKVMGIFSENFSSVAKMYLIYSEIRKFSRQKHFTTDKQKKAEELAKSKVPVDKQGPEKLGDSTMESFRLRSFTQFLTESDSQSKSPVLTELSKLYKGMSSRGEKETLEVMQSIINGGLLKTSPGARSSLKRIYEQIRVKMGLKITTVKESNIETFLSENETILQEGIVSLYKATSANPKAPGEQIQNKEIIDKLNQEIEKFNSTMKACLSPDLYVVKDEVKKEEDKKENTTELKKGVPEDNKSIEKPAKPKSESLIYGRYRKIYEADEDEEEEPKEDNRSKVSEYWNEKMDLNKYAVSEEEVERIKSELDKKIAQKKDSLDIQNMDPILEVVKIFNRAYKLHTTQVIESGRSAGKVSNSVFLEYTSFGSGKPDSAGSDGGPYRHNATFDKWESAVLDIMKNKEYQRIFNMGTRVKVGNEYVEQAGANLRKFMNDLLDGDELYKGGERGGPGAQAKFLDKYFGYKDVDPNSYSYKGPEKQPDAETNGQVADGIKDVKLEFKNSPYKEEGKTSIKGTFFTITLRSADKPKTYYCLVQDESNEYAYITLSRTGAYILEGLKKSMGDRTIKEDIRQKSKKDDNGKNYVIYATRIKKTRMIDSGTIKFPETFTLEMINYAEKDGKVDNSSGEIKAIDPMRDCRLESMKVSVDVSSEKTEEQKAVVIEERGRKYMIQQNGGFDDIKSNVDRMRVEIKV